jgi:hypothetical protein
MGDPQVASPIVCEGKRRLGLAPWERDHRLSENSVTAKFAECLLATVQGEDIFFPCRSCSCGGTCLPTMLLRYSSAPNGC